MVLLNLMVCLLFSSIEGSQGLLQTKLKDDVTTTEDEVSILEEGITALMDDAPTQKDEITNVRLTSAPKSIHLKPTSVYRLMVEKLDNETDFLIFEAHSLRLNLLLSMSTMMTDVVNSTSPALFATAPQLLDMGGVILKNPHAQNITIIAFVRSYSKSSPVPGYCNTEHGIPVKSFLELSWTQPMVHLKFRQAGTLGSCKDLNAFKYDVYQYFLQENDCSDKQFVEGYKNMVEFDDILANANLLATLTHRHTSINLTNYPRTGRIIAVVVSLKNESAVYGLGHTYGCATDPNTQNGCEEKDSTFVWVSCALGVFVGLFLTFGGHRFFKSSQFLFGFYFGSLVGFVLVSLYMDSNETILIVLTSTSGLTTALLILALWWFLGIPVLSVILPTLQTGFILASVLMYLPLCSLGAFVSDSTFWLVFTCITLSPTVLFIAFTQKASIISCVVLGTFTFILSVDQYIGSNLRFVLINVLNRITVQDFGKSYRCPPFQKMDLILVTCLLAGIAFGLICQLIIERKKPPFPPAPFQQWRWVRSYDNEEERAPLITGDLNDSVEPARAAAVVGYISGHAVSDQLGSQRSDTRIRQKQVLTGGPPNQRRDIFSPAGAPDR